MFPKRFIFKSWLIALPIVLLVYFGIFHKFQGTSNTGVTGMYNAITFADKTLQSWIVPPLPPVPQNNPGNNSGKRIVRHYSGGRPWFMTGGVAHPSPSNKLIDQSYSLWYDPKIQDDRIIDQLLYVVDNPANVNASVLSSRDFKDRDETNKEFNDKPGESSEIINIFFQGPWDYSGLPNGRFLFLNQKCPVNTCRIVNSGGYSMEKGGYADVVVLSKRFHYKRDRPGQILIVFEGESPHHSTLHTTDVEVNLTATYRRDSDIPNRYQKWAYFDENVRTLNHTTNFAAGKTKKVAMFVSNCNPRNNRMEYARELGEHIQVDIYGRCGSFSCPTFKRDECYKMLSRDYKFYLAFENSNCRDYISEKFFDNGLGNMILPIVMGAHPKDYAHAAPPDSFLHVEDFASPKELAKYLHKLDKDDSLYNEYFKWKGTGEVIFSYWFCRLCAVLHYIKENPKEPASIHPQDLAEKWWKGKNVCIDGGWKDAPDIFAVPD